MIVGLILAGGAGRRIGGGKAMAPLGGKPMIAHVAAAIADVSACAVAGDAAAAAAIGADFISDPVNAPRGPLAGVLAGLEWCAAKRARWLVVAPCDAPFLPHNLAARLCAAAGDGALACAETTDGLEPLISIWRADTLHALRSALSERRHPPVHAFAAALGAAHLPLSRAEAMNVNTPEERALAESMLSQR